MPNHDYSLAKIGRKWMLTTGRTAGPTVVLTADAEFSLRSVLDLLDKPDEEAARRYGKLRVGKRTWLTCIAIGDQYVKGVAVSDDENAVDEILSLMMP